MATIAPPRVSPVVDERAHISRVPYLPGLDGMRAIAVIAVMVYHANSGWLPGGFLGVEMFFVISGYLITLLLIAERERTYRVSLRHFWMRRARRLLPAVFVMMGLVAVWTAVFKPDALGQLRGDVLAGTGYVSNWYQVWVGLGYTAAADFAPLRHLWSLGVEEQFYLLWPLVMIGLLGRAGTRRIANVSKWLFAASIVITVVVALAYHPGTIGAPEQTPEAYWWLGDRPISKLDTLYLSTFSRAGGLLLGAAFAMVWRPFAVVRGPLRERGRAFDLAALLALIVLGLMCWNTYLITPEGAADPFLFRGGFFVASLATLVVIAAVSHQHAVAGRLLGNRVFLWVGTRSYGLYLYHWPIYQMMRDVAGNKLDVGQFAIAMVLTGVITELSYRFVELPIRKGRFWIMIRRARMHPNPRRQSALAGGIAVALGLSLFATVTLATAELKPNEVAADLDEAEEFTTDLASLSAGSSDLDVELTLPPAVATVATTTVAPTTVAPTTVATTAPPTTVATAASTVPGAAATTVAAPVVPASTAVPTTVPPTTAPPPVTTPPPVAQLGVVTDMNAVTPLLITPTSGGIPLIALGDSVMLGASEELGARGFVVDAVVSRQMVTFLPDLQAIRDAGTLGSVVVFHLGTNGPFSQATLDSMMALLADVPTVIALTGKADRAWVGSNNDKVRALPAAYPNVTVIDWQVLAQSCEGRCFYEDGIHLTQTGQDYYTSLITRVLGLA